MFADNFFDILVVALVLIAITFLALCVIFAKSGGVKSLREFLNEDISLCAVFLSNKIEEAFLTYKLVYIVIIVFVVEFSYSWYQTPKDMREMTFAIVQESYIIAGPIKDGIRAVWRVASNPWRLIGYVLFVFLLRLRPDLLNDITKAAEKRTEGY